MTCEIFRGVSDSDLRSTIVPLDFTRIVVLSLAIHCSMFLIPSGGGMTLIVAPFAGTITALTARDGGKLEI